MRECEGKPKPWFKAESGPELLQAYTRAFLAYVAVEGVLPGLRALEGLAEPLRGREKNVR